MSKKLIKLIISLVLILAPVIIFAQSPAPTSLSNPIGEADPRVVLGRAINGALSIVGALSLTTFVYGGFIWMLSFGNPERVKKGLSILTWGFYGLMIIFSSYAIINFMLGSEGFLATFFFV